MKKYLILIILILTGECSLWADVATDGSLGSQTTISGPTYSITEDYGERRGENLYHSFSTFNIGAGETADFSADSETTNIISRVTGGDPSRIDGTLQCNIPGADLWLLNPSGLVFGQNASLNINGSFFASTCDYLSMGDGELFYTNLNEYSVLSYESPAAFGFLKESNADIIFEGRGTGDTGLKVPTEEDIFICGGNISVSGSSDSTGVLNPNFSAPSGRVILNAVQNEAEVNIEERYITNEITGTIELKENALINTDGEYEGEVFIRAGKFYMNDSTISAGGPEFDVGSELGFFDGSVIIEATDIHIENNSLIESVAKGEKNAGFIVVQDCKNFALTSGSRLSTSTDATGSAGAISINADNINIDSSVITTSSTGIGNAGAIQLDSNQTTISNSTISSSRSYNDNDGFAGTIFFNAEESLTIKDNSEIKTESTYAGGGIIGLYGKTLVISDSRISTEVKSGFNKGGNIDIFSELLLLNKASLIAKAYIGDGGDIYISAANMIKSGDSTINASSQFGFNGYVEVDAPASELPSGFSVFNAALPDPEQWAVTPCSARSGEAVSSFFITTGQLVKKDYGKWFRNHLFLQHNEK